MFNITMFGRIIIIITKYHMRYAMGFYKPIVKLGYNVMKMLDNKY